MIHPSAPQSPEFRQELQYLENKGRLPAQERLRIEDHLTQAETDIGVPKALLWCILFQESRMDAYKNALDKVAAKGMGQFTPNALAEINEDTNHYDSRTRGVLELAIAPGHLPLDFKLKSWPRVSRAGFRYKQLPEQAPSSYFNARTAVFASGAFLNNRYQQIKRALDRQAVVYDPEVLWLYAAAAYNKGSRTVLVLLTDYYLSKGEKALSALLTDGAQSVALLTHEKLLHAALKDMWRKRRRDNYLEEMSRNMQAISSCVNPEIRL